MPKCLKFEKKNKKNQIVNVGSMEIRNQSEESADLYFLGDICNESWQSDWYEDDKCPKDVEEFLKELDEIQEINIHINSGGGSVFGGIAIYNMLKRHKAKKNVYVEGIAASIASVIAMVGDMVMIPENAILMVHKPLCAVWGNADDMRKEAEVLDTCQNAIVSIYMEKVKEGVAEEQINDLINAESWMTGKEAAEYFDIIVGPVNDIAASNSSYFEKYNNIPDKFKKKEEENSIPTAEEIADALYKKMQEDTRKKENRKKAILADLDII